jgi:hypothetical protein
MMEKVEVNRSQGENIEVPCSECARKTHHTVLQSVDTSGRDDYGPNDWFAWDNHFQIIQCQGCKTISFRRTHENSEDYYQVGDSEWEPQTHENLYPSRVAGRKKLRDEHLLPPKVRLIYNETIEALVNGQKVLTGIGLRAVVETVCKDKSAEGKDLSEKINYLAGQGMLTKDGAEILHKLRTLGNEAAHEVKPHNQEQLALAMDVVQHLLEGAYIFTEKVKRTFSD